MSEETKKSLQDLLFVKPGDHIVGHDMHGHEVDATIYDIEENGLHYTYGNRFMRGLAGMSRERCIRKFGKYRPRIKREHMKYLVKDNIVERYFEEKYDGLYLLPWYEVKKPKEGDYDFGHQDILGDYIDIYRAASKIGFELSYSSRGDTITLETCELIGKLMNDAAENARLYWNATTKRKDSE